MLPSRKRLSRFALAAGLVLNVLIVLLPGLPPSTLFAAPRTTTSPPTIVTVAATFVGTATARLNGNLVSLGTASTVDVSFEYGPTTAYGSTTPTLTKTAAGIYDWVLDSLIPGTVYHFRAKAEGDGTSYGEDMTFMPGTPPNVETYWATGASTLWGKLWLLGTATEVSVSFEWGTTASYGNVTPPVTMTTANGAYFGALISGLVPGTTYHFRAKAVGHGTAYGGDASFTTFSPMLTGKVALSGYGQYNQLYVMNADGTGLGPLMPSNVAYSPAWSPDGSKIAYYSGSQVCVANADGSNVRTLGYYDSPAWSPDSQRLAVSSYYSGTSGNPEIYVMNQDGTGATRLTYSTAYDVHPTWSADGTRLAFASDRDGNYEIYVINVNGTGLTRLTSNTVNDNEPSWSPDGSKIAFNRNGDIYVMNPDGTNQVRLTTTGSCGSPGWSPDGGKIIFQRYSAICIMYADGSNVTQVSPANSTSYYSHPTWATGTWTPQLAVSTSSATAIGLDSARLNGSLLSTGTASSVNVCFEYGLTTSYGSTTPPQAMTSTGAFNTVITGLTTGITYHYRAKADGGAAGTALGSDITFTTLALPPVVTTGAATAVTASSATLNGNLTSLGTAATATVLFEYGSTTSYGSSTTGQTMTAIGAFSANLSGLTTGGLYHYHAKAVSTYGTGYGTDVTFTTIGSPPRVITSGATSVTGNSAALNGNLAALGTATTVNVTFEYGPSSTYGTATIPQAMTAPGPFNAGVTGLSNATTYHFRAKADGGVHGTGNGADTVFTTGSIPPTVVTGDAAGITHNTATLNGVLTALGTAPTVNVSFEWGTTASYGNATPAQALTATASFNTGLTGLSPARTYHFRARADNSNHGIGTGQDMAFTTSLGPLTGKIAFASNRTGSYQLYIMSPDGSNQTRITGDMGITSGSEPVISPDGTRIVYMTNRDGNSEIYLANLTGSSLLRLTNNNASDFSPAWSADGTRIAFVSTRDGNYEIYLMNADGTGQTRLTASPASESHPAWAPDGSKIALTSNRDGVTTIFTMNVDGSNMTRLTDGTTYDTYPVWSPDGSKIAFYRNYQVWVMNADGTSQTQLTGTTTGAASSRARPSGARDPEPTPTPVPVQPPYSYVQNSSPAWSPDGSRIAFVSNRDGNTEIYLMNADGSGQTRLTSNTYADEHPSWGPGNWTSQMIVLTTAVTAVTNNSARLNGDLASLGNAATVNVSFQWGAGQGTLSNETTAQAKTSTGSFDAALTSLNAGVTYRFRAKADGGVMGTAYGLEMTFTTGISTPPVVITNAASNITSVSAVLNGTVTSFGTAAAVIASFEYGVTTAYGANTMAQIMTSAGPFNAAISGLTPNSTYHFRARADGGAAGTALGTDMSFTTTSATVEVNSGNTIILNPGGSQASIPLAIKNLPAFSAGNGVGAFTFNLSWNKDVINVTAISAASVSVWTIQPSAPNNTTGTAVITGFTGSNYLTADTTVATINITAVGASGTSTALAVAVTSLGDKNSIAIPATAVNAAVQVQGLLAETALASGLDADGTAVLNVSINRIKNPADGSTSAIPGGIGGYSATASSSPAGGVEFITVRGVTPYDNPSFNAATGVFGVAIVASPAQPSNSTIARVVPRLTGDCNTTYTINVAFQQINAATGGTNVPEEQPNSLSFRRGDASRNGTVDIFDAMFIAQYVVGNRSFSEISILNAACVKHDGTTGDKIDIFDAMYIAQYIIGARNNRFE